MSIVLRYVSEFLPNLNKSYTNLIPICRFALLICNRKFGTIISEKDEKQGKPAEKYNFLASITPTFAESAAKGVPKGPVAGIKKIPPAWNLFGLRAILLMRGQNRDCASG